MLPGTRDLSTDTTLKRKNLSTDFTTWTHATVHIKVPQVVIRILHLVTGQLKVLRLLSGCDHGEDVLSSFTDSSGAVYMREELRAAQAVVGEPDTELATLH